MRSSARQMNPRNLDSFLGRVRLLDFNCTLRTEVEMHIHASSDSVLSFSVNQYTLAQGNGAEGTAECVCLLDHVEVR